MSLINDALKRAKQIPAPANVPPADESSGLRPVEYQARPFWVRLTLPVLLLLTGALAGWFLIQGWEITREAGRRNREIPVAARSAQPAEPPLESVTMASVPAVAPAPVVPTTNAALLAPAATSTPAAGATANPAPTFPTLKLQGIYYRPSNPSVVINSKSLFRGEKLEGVKVIHIEPDSVTVEWNGETKVLTLQ